MKRQYSQYAQKAFKTAAIPEVGMQSMYFNTDDDGNPTRIDPAGHKWPVGGVRVIDEGGQVGWSLATNRARKGNIGNRAIDFTEMHLFESFGGAQGDDSIAIGINTSTKFNKTISIGYNILAVDGIALGKFNIGNPDNRLEIGFGVADKDRLNILEINRFNVASLPNTLAADIANPKDIVTLEKLELLTQDIDEHTFAIKGDLEEAQYPGFLPYVPTDTTKEVIGIRWFLKSGSCTIKVMEYDAATGTIIAEDNITAGTVGQNITANPNLYFSLTDGNRVILDISHIHVTAGATDLSVTVILINK